MYQSLVRYIFASPRRERRNHILGCPQTTASSLGFLHRIVDGAAEQLLFALDMADGTDDSWCKVVLVASNIRMDLVHGVPASLVNNNLCNGDLWIQPLGHVLLWPYHGKLHVAATVATEASVVLDLCQTLWQ